MGLVFLGLRALSWVACLVPGAAGEEAAAAELLC